MKYVLMLAMLVGGALSASATVITFDDLSGSGVVPAGYAGFNSWGGWTYYDSPQDPYNAHSGAERVYATSEPASHIVVGHAIIFDGAWFSGYGSQNGLSDVFFNMYLGGTLVHQSGTVSPNNVPQFLSSGYTGQVDEIAIGLTGNQNYGFQVMDDVTYHAVPEPASLSVLGVGALLAARRRRASKK